MRRWIVLGQAVVLLTGTLWGSPAQATQVNGAVDAAYGYYDPQLNGVSDRRVELVQSYTLSLSGDIWAPEVGSYRSTLRYDTTAQSLEESGGVVGNNMRGVSVETRVFPYSPLNLTMGVNAHSTKADAGATLSGATAIDEAGFYGRLGVGFAGLPPTTLQFSHNTTAGYRGEGDSTTTSLNSSTDQVSLATVLRQKATQTQISLQSSRTSDKLFGSDTNSQGASVIFTGALSPQWQVRASAETGLLDTSRIAGTTDAQRQSVSLRTVYQVGAGENLQVALSGTKSHQVFAGASSGEREDFSTSVSGQYTKNLRGDLRGVLGANSSRMTVSAPSDPASSTVRGTSSVRGEVNSGGLGRLTWLGALSLEQLEVDSSLKPGATLEGRAEYRLRPDVGVGTAVTVYRNTSPGTAAPTDETGRLGLQGSVRWVGGTTGRASLVVASTSRQFAAGTGSDNKITLTGGVSPRGDLDLSADFQSGRSEAPTLSGGWSQDTSLTAAVGYRPRSDLTVTLNVSHQETDTADGTRLIAVSVLKAEYLYYALRFGASAKWSQVEDLSGQNQRAAEYLISVHRDF